MALLKQPQIKRRLRLANAEFPLDVRAVDETENAQRFCYPAHALLDEPALALDILARAILIMAATAAGFTLIDLPLCAHQS